jgi:phenylalanyl-tRNA synthetase alpha chain
MNLENLGELKADAIAAISAAATIDELRGIEIAHLGKSAPLTLANRELAGLDAEGKRTFGAAINAARTEVSGLFADRKLLLETDARRAALESDRLDLSEFRAGESSESHGHLHLITQTIRDLEDIFVGMGFSVFNQGPEAETDWENFEALNFPPSHPARTMHDTFWLELGAQEQVLMRTHTSPMQIRVMKQMAPPIYAVMPGRCYRRDTADARHLPVFHQIEALVIDKDISLGHLAGTIETFVTAYFGRDDLKARLRPGFFPFTEPSAEFEITCPFCTSGCRVCSGTGWIELGGCGMVHPNVLRNGGVDPEEWTGFAWGFGIDRLAMNRHQIDDLRVFLDNDARLLRQF